MEKGDPSSRRETVIEHVLSRIRQLGVTDVFGVPGDYAFPVNDAICNDAELRWIGTSNELNAAYAADGYGRIRGVAALSTTYGVGELSALCGIAGSYSEHVPVFHLVGMPNSGTQRTHSLVHHTLGNGEFDLFHRMAQPVVCASAILTPDNAVTETERLIAAAMYHRRPVYMAFPADYAHAPIVENGEGSIPAPQSDPEALEAAVSAIMTRLDRAKTACILPGIFVARLGLRAEATALVEASGLPFATMFMDKTVLDEQHPNYIGMYEGKLMQEEVRAFVEGCDLVLGLSALLTDFNTGAFTANIDRSKSVNVMHHHVRVGNAIYQNVEMKDLLVALTRRVGKRSIEAPVPSTLGEPEGRGDDPITAEALYPRWSRFLEPDDILIAETGTISMGAGFARMPKGATFQNQTLWGACGWATPAALGAALAAPQRRTVLITGDGSHQVGVQEIGQFHRYGLKPVVFVLNNSGYLIERMLCVNPEICYNDLADWRYAQLPEALGCDGWYTAKVSHCGELDEALVKAEAADTGVYIEVVTEKYVAPELSQKLHDAMATLYKT